MEGIGVAQDVQEGQGVLLGIEHREGLRLIPHQVCDLRPCERLVDAPLVGHSTELLEERLRIRHDLDSANITEDFNRLKGGLRGGRDDHGGAVVRAKLLEHIKDGLKEVWWKR